MRLAICDDSAEDLAALEEQISYYQKQKVQKYIELKYYQDVDRLFEGCSKQPFDAVILDILMPKMNGIEAGHQLRRLYPNTVIIYLSSSPEFALDAYEIHAERYLTKPIIQDKLFEALNLAMEQSQKNMRFFTLKTANGMSVVRHDQIVYVELSSRKMIVHLVDGSDITSIYLRDTFMDTIAELLECSNFVLTHKSFLVNMQYIKSYSQNHMIMINQEIVPVSRQHVAKVRTEYLQYLAHGDL